MVALKVRKIGDSVGIVLPAEVLGVLHIDEGDTLYLTEMPGGLRLTPYNPESERQLEAARKVMKKRRDVLRALAK